MRRAPFGRGAIGGFIAGLFPGSIIGAVAGGAVGSIVVQSAELAIGWRCSFSVTEVVFSAAMGGLAQGAANGIAKAAPKVACFFRAAALRRGRRC